MNKRTVFIGVAVCLVLIVLLLFVRTGKRYVDPAEGGTQVTDDTSQGQKTASEDPAGQEKDVDRAEAPSSIAATTDPDSASQNTTHDGEGQNSTETETESENETEKEADGEKIDHGSEGIELPPASFDEASGAEQGSELSQEPGEEQEPAEEQEQGDTEEQEKPGSQGIEMPRIPIQK